MVLIQFISEHVCMQVYKPDIRDERIAVRNNVKGKFWDRIEHRNNV